MYSLQIQNLLMKKVYQIFLIFLFSYSCISNKKKVNDNIVLSNKFNFGIEIGTIRNNKIKEASGLAHSIMNSNSLWVHNDSGDGPFLYLISTIDSKYYGNIKIKGIKNEDWEDLAIGPSILDEDSSFIYIGEIGDNKKKKKIKKIYFFKEPKITDFSKTIEIDDFYTIRFSTDKKIEDFETLMIDPNSKEIFIVSKSKKNKQKIYKIKTKNIDLNKIQVAKKILSLDFKSYNGKITGGDISYNGNECLIKTYDNIFYWKKKHDQKWENIWGSSPTILNYNPEPQGEAICWSLDSQSYFTLSENENKNQDQKLYKYSKN